MVTKNTLQDTRLIILEVVSPNCLALPMQLTLGCETREVHPEDYNEATYKKLLETVVGKQEVCFINGNGTREYGYVSSYSNVGNLFVKFSHTLLGFLYTDDAWEATTAKYCGGLQVEFINPDTHDQQN